MAHRCTAKSGTVFKSKAAAERANHKDQIVHEENPKSGSNKISRRR
jgi:hypothetical protein